MDISLTIKKKKAMFTTIYVQNTVKKKCKCRLIRTGDDYKVTGDHNHTPTPTDLPRTKILDSLKTKAKTDRVAAQKLIAEAVGPISSQVAVKLPTMSQITRTINLSRNAEHFATAKNSDGLNLSSMYTTTVRGDNFLLHDNGIDEDRLLFLALCQC